MCFIIYTNLTKSINSIFFFQAEDGIRDLTVTGVQTCALPICSRSSENVKQVLQAGIHHSRRRAFISAVRSEERRVGKECRSRLSAFLEEEKFILHDCYSNIS